MEHFNRLPLLTRGPAWADAKRTALFATGADFACPPPPPGDIWQCLDTVLVVTTRGFVLWASSRKRPGMLPDYTLFSDHLAQNVSSAEVEKPCLWASSGLGMAALPPLGHQTLI